MLGTSKGHPGSKVLYEDDSLDALMVVAHVANGDYKDSNSDGDGDSDGP